MKPPRSVLLLRDDQDPRAVAECGPLKVWLEERSVQVMEADWADSHLHDAAPVDLVLVLGGDGTFLQAIRKLQSWEVPFLGVRFGSFGYLAELEPESWPEELERLLAGEGRVEEWPRLYCEVVDENGQVEHLGLATNEVLVRSAQVTGMVELVLSIDGEKITRYRGDGLILATPAGSTAHSLAAGGPILEATQSGILLTPLASHALTWRPLVLDAERRIELHAESPRHGVAVTLDGRVGAIREKSVSVRVAGGRPVRVATVVKRSRFRTLRERLHWGAPLIERSGDLL